MSLPPELATIDGAKDIYDWFGQWPTFHDAEIVRLHLNRTGPSLLAIHTWQMTGELDERGSYVLTKHVVVEFVLFAVSDLELRNFGHQNVLSGLDVQKTDAGFHLILGPCYGLAGSLDAAGIRIRLSPGEPTDRPQKFD